MKTFFIVFYTIFVVINTIICVRVLYNQYKRYNPITILDIIITFIVAFLSFPATLFIASDVTIFQRKD